jgi:hypothetical protein
VLLVHVEELAQQEAGIGELLEDLLVEPPQFGQIGLPGGAQVQRWAVRAVGGPREQVVAVEGTFQRFGGCSPQSARADVNSSPPEAHSKEWRFVWRPVTPSG